MADELEPPPLEDPEFDEDVKKQVRDALDMFAKYPPKTDYEVAKTTKGLVEYLRWRAISRGFNPKRFILKILEQLEARKRGR